MRRVLGSVTAALVVAACTAPSPPPEPVPITPPSEVAGAPIVRRPIAETPPPVAALAPTLPITPPQPAVVVPPDTLYVCVSESGGQRQQTSIEFSPKIGELCRKHPEMGPCQYERNVCRRSGGRVYAANGVEITTQTEAEYDKKVMRVRFKAN